MHDNHDHIEECFISELNELKSGSNNSFFSKKLNKFVKIHLELIASLGDQPERRNMNYMLNGNSNYCARYGYSCNMYEIKENLPLCEDCYHLLKECNTHENTKCGKCLRWDILSNIELSCYTPPSSYPKEMIPKSGKLSPLRLNWNILNSAVSLTTNKLIRNEWSEF